MKRSWATRLHRDLKELQQEPLEGIQVHVDESNMQLMCLILTPSGGPFRGFKLHLSVSIPDEYPRAPPVARIQTIVPHPNVFCDGYICCDILKQKAISQAYFFSDGPDYNGGYTPGYLLNYIFLQLLSFFSSDNVEQDYGGATKLEDYVEGYDGWKSDVGRFVCGRCGFNKTFSAVVDQNHINDPSTTTTNWIRNGDENEDGGEGGRSLFDTLDAGCCIEIMDRLSDQDIIKLSQAFQSIKELADSHNVLLRRQLVCFYFRKTFRESVLGVGTELNRRTDGSPGKPIVTVFDLFSHEAYDKHFLRNGVTGEKFTHFLPLVLDDDHFRRGYDLIKDSLMRLSGSTTWKAETALQTIPAMMNMMVLQLVDTLNSKQKKNQVAVIKASEKALQGYCLLFHLFFKLVRSEPMLENEIKRRVASFVGDRRRRSKADVRDLGEFLTYLLVIRNLNWEQFCPMFLEELLARNVVWYLQSYPHLAYLEPDSFPSDLRLRDTFTASEVSLKLVMFQVSFFNMTRSIEGDFDERYGYPSGEMSCELLKVIKEIYAVGDWDVFLRLIKFPIPQMGWKWRVSGMLKAAIRLSEERKYHVSPYTRKELYLMRSRLEQNCPAPEGWALDAASYAGKRSFPAAGKRFFPPDPSRGSDTSRRRW